MPPGTKKYLILNGHFYETGKAIFSSENRAFRYGDGLFETMRCHKTVPLFFDDHYERLLRGMAVMRMSVAALPPLDIFKGHIERLIVRNRIFSDARVRLSVFRREGGLYTPESNSISWLLEATPLKEKGYQLNEDGLKIGVFHGFPKTWNLAASFKTLNCTPYVLAGLHKNEQHWDDCLIENQDKQLIESISSNLFWTKNGQLFTPGLPSGCVDGIMRKNTLQFAASQSIAIKETGGVSKEELLNAEEVFLTNSVNGIRWVMAFEEKRYFNKLPKEITRWLNKAIQLQIPG
ncbi:aminotransferase class IV [Marinilabilia rubra]|uniref:branched-chain-amino-acid transaminase n=1 Tax=Marinilabilia rubra TaxID=2162893 RepID=A0A2U2BA31_9BACT|nr:aminotransferase class IV [Marinilabilia rubra]PWD99930.1 aminotransferase IV [Marinilabilia rubra]